MSKDILIIGHIIRFHGGKVDILGREETSVKGKLIRTVCEYFHPDWNDLDLATALKKVMQINLRQGLKCDFQDADELIDYMNEVQSDCKRVEEEWAAYSELRVSQSKSENGDASL
jgi:hypothetical protein